MMASNRAIRRSLIVHKGLSNGENSRLILRINELAVMYAINLSYLCDLVTVLVSKDIKLRYRGTIFGILWSLANPLAFMAVLYIAFKRVLQVDIPNYPLFILAALFPWQWLSNSLNSASSLFVLNAGLIKKFRFPRFALCLALVLSEMFHFLITLPVFATIHFLSNIPGPAWAWLVGIPILLLAQASLTVSVVIILATVNAFFRDLEQLIRVFLLFLFYLTPVLYPVSMVPEGLHWLLVVNPFAPLIISWRALLLDNVLSPYILLTVFYAFLAVIIAISVYKNMEWKLAEVV